MPLAAAQVQQRLDAERVAGERELAGRLSAMANANMPRNRSRAADPQCRHASSTTSVSELVRKEAPCFSSSLAELTVVVELAVIDERQVALDQRLVGRRGQVDDRQPPVAEVDGGALVLVAPERARVRTPVRDPLGHDVGQLVPVGLLVAPGDTAHAR